MMEATEARRELLASAKATCDRYSFREWEERLAPRSAIDAVTRREVDAIYGLFWEPRRKGSRKFSIMGRT